MSKPTIGILHPGAMGISVAVSAKNSGYKVYWASNGRSSQSQQRANEHDPARRRHSRQPLRTCHIILSVCPPHAAEDVAQQVIAHGFTVSS